MQPMEEYRFIAEPGQLTVVQTCLIDASPEALFNLLLDSKAIPHFWGPAELATVVETLDARPGGLWRYIQTDLTGEVYAFHGHFHLIESPQKIIYTFEYEGDSGHIGLEEISFQLENGKTRISDVTVFLHPEVRDAMVQAGMESGARETFERMAALVAKNQG